MTDIAGIETRSRSRSKTPGLLSNENGDSKGAKKVPSISLIEEEEDVIEVSSQPSQRPKRQRRSAKNVQSDTSGDAQLETVVSNSKQSKNTVTAATTTTTTIIQTSKQTINGTEEKSEESTSVKTTTHTTSNNDAPEIPESQSIFNNIFNAIKTSTPILSTKRTKRTTHENSSLTGNVDFNLHPAYKEYKEAGEYWNKFPKTDYTYSELSPHRRELGSGIVAMPNMSRKSLDKYQNRIEAMIQQNPTEESFIRRKFLSNMSYQKKSADLQYDSADEVDVSDLYKNLSARRNSQKNVFSRFIMFIVGVFSSSYSNLKRRVTYGSKQHLSYTPIKRHHQQGFLRSVYNFAQRFVLLCISKLYLFVSTILCLDTWLLYTRSENTHQNHKRKRFLIGLLVLLPLMLFGALLLSEDNNIITTKNYRIERLNYLTQYFSGVSLPSIPHFNFGWILSPLFYLGALFRGFVSYSTTKQPDFKLDEEKFNVLLKHINEYVDNTIQEKLKLSNDILINQVNDRLVFTIANHLNDALKQYEYHLTTKDVELIVNQIKVQLNNDLDEKEKSILAKISLNNQENIEKIKSIASVSMRQQQSTATQNIDLDKIIAMILESNKLSIFLDDHIATILNSDVEKIKSDIVGKFAVYNDELNRIKIEQTSISDDLIRFKRENDEAMKSILMKITDKFATFSDFSSIDLSVRKSLLNILGLKNPEIGDEALLKEWIENTFVAKSYLEQHLQKLELKLDEAFSKQVDKNAGIFMEDVNEKLKNQIKILVEQKNEELKSTNLNIVGGGLTEADVIKIVKDILAIYDADKTGLVDYSLESAGGEIISTRCTENYRTKSAEISIFGIPIWYPRNTPRTVISPTIAPGECWAFQGFPGFLVIKLSNLIKVTGFTVEHIPQSNAPNNVIDSAPNNFSVWGLTSEFDKNPILFGNYFYSASKDAPSLQYFPVQNKEIEQPHQFVELVIESNHGNTKYTCLYRFRVHGEIN
ncbi:klaroid protein [Chironomus tepperi]|uniref:klaroid protein n=1 Tax=Chironomus tepperi TaxID=113505 RepID=UPI00391FAAFA